MTRKQIEAMMAKQKEVAKTKPFMNTEMGQYAYQLGFEDGANFSFSHQWVSVVDEMPEVGELVLTTFIDYKGKRRYAAGKRTGDGMQVYGVISPSPFPPVTHWMPIPPIVEEGGEKK